MKIYQFQLRFLWSLFARVLLTIFQHWFRYWLGSGPATSHYMNQWCLVYWCICASLSLNELTEVSMEYGLQQWAWAGNLSDRIKVRTTVLVIPMLTWFEFAKQSSLTLILACCHFNIQGAKSSNNVWCHMDSMSQPCWCWYQGPDLI